VTIGDASYRLPEPFFVLATQNPIEQEGTYSLPEAELDRFLLKLLVPYPTLEEEAGIVRQASGGNLSGSDRSESDLPLFAAPGADAQGVPSPAIASDDLERIRADVRSVRCDEALLSYLVSITAATRPLADPKRPGRQRDDYLKYISFGASPRASIALAQCARIRAFFEGRDFVIPEDIKSSAYPVLRHRLVLSYEAGADGLSADDIISKVLSVVPLP
jgi:MoxR-like ATPase